MTYHNKLILSIISCTAAALLFNVHVALGANGFIYYLASVVAGSLVALFILHVKTRGNKKLCGESFFPVVITLLTLFVAPIHIPDFLAMGGDLPNESFKHFKEIAIALPGVAIIWCSLVAIVEDNGSIKTVESLN